MNRATLLALAERVEAATAPDRGIEREIAIAVGWHFYDRKVDHTRPAIEQWWRPGATTPSTDFPRFMASLDAAMSLVPSGGFIAALSEIAADGMPGCCICTDTSTTPPTEFWGLGLERGDRWEVLARCVTAASLRAIAGSLTDD